MKNAAGTATSPRPTAAHARSAKEGNGQPQPPFRPAHTVDQRVRQWLEKRQCETIFITPGSPWENPYIESFIGTLRRECLDHYLFDDVRQAQELLKWWRQEYNCYRLHSLLGYLTPEAFAEQARAANILAGSANSETIVTSNLSF